jgi:hypothetical protein
VDLGETKYEHSFNDWSKILLRTNQTHFCQFLHLLELMIHETVLSFLIIFISMFLIRLGWSAVFNTSLSKIPTVRDFYKMDQKPIVQQDPVQEEKKSI